MCTLIIFMRPVIRNDNKNTFIVSCHYEHSQNSVNFSTGTSYTNGFVLNNYAEKRLTLHQLDPQKAIVLGNTLRYICSDLKTRKKGKKIMYILSKTEENDIMGALDGYSRILSPQTFIGKSI